MGVGVGVGGIPDAVAPTSLSVQVPQLLVSLSHLVPAALWLQPITARVLDPLHKWSYADVAAALVACVHADLGRGESKKVRVVCVYVCKRVCECM